MWQLLKVADRDGALSVTFTPMVTTTRKAYSYTADLIQITLFFCICFCKYINTQPHCCATQFCFRYLQFHNVDGVIPHNTPDQA